VRWTEREPAKPAWMRTAGAAGFPGEAPARRLPKARRYRVCFGTDGMVPAAASQ
jgi:hypothetical protein